MKTTLARLRKFSTAVILLPVLSIAAANAAPDPNFHIYLLLGQSNMQGAAHLPATPITHPRVQVMQAENCPERTQRYGQWRELAQPICRCKITDTRPKTGGGSGLIGLGPGDTFGVAMADASPNATIGLVGPAMGDTALEYWLKNCNQYNACATPSYTSVAGAPNNGDNGGYVWILELAKKAQEVGVIKGIIFHQGENNAGNGTSGTWLARVNQFVTDLRTDLKLDPNEVPFIAGELPHTGGSAKTMNPIIQRIQGTVANGWWVSGGPMPDGTVLGDRGDGIHWSTDSVVEMGKRYAAKMLEVGQYGPVDCDSVGGVPICCNISADPDGDGIGLQNGDQACTVTEATAGWHQPNPTDVVAAINVGGSEAEAGGIWYDADKYFSGGKPNTTQDAVAGANGSAIYSSERYGDFSYKIPVSNGDYTVQFGNVELYQTSANARSFNISVEGTQVIDRLDIFSAVGKNKVLLSAAFDTKVSDGNLDIVVSTNTDNGTLSSILVRKKSSSGSSSSSSSNSSSSSSNSSSSSSSNSSSSSSSSSGNGGNGSNGPGQPTKAGSMTLLLMILLSVGLAALRKRII